MSIFLGSSSSRKSQEGKNRIMGQKELVLNNYTLAIKWFKEVNKQLLSKAKMELDSWLKRRNKLIDQPL